MSKYLFISFSVLFIFLTGFNISINQKKYPLVKEKGYMAADSFPPTMAMNYQSFCGGCHGEKMNAFVDRVWKHGNTREDLFKGIKSGYPDEGMPAFDSAFKDQEIFELADYIITGIKNVNRYVNTDKPISNIFKTEKIKIRLDTVVNGLDVPWSMVFLPNNEMLITERSGILYHRSRNGKLTTVTGTPKVVVGGQGGLMDIALDPAFSKNRFIYITYSLGKTENNKELATTAVMKARYENGVLSDQSNIFIAQPYSTTRHHYGSRLQFGKDGYLYFTVGERGNEKQNPQQILGNDLGKVHRIKTDGTVPQSNPFVNVPGASTSIYSYGHRNPQGLTMDFRTGKIWENEHGPRGGDEINIIEAGKNYGWPVITYGINYNGRPMAPDTKTAKEGMEQPFLQWTPSIAPSGMTFVTGNRYKDWKGNLLSGSLRFQYLNRSEIKNNKVVKEEILFKNIGRVRDIRMGPDGYLYMAVEKPGIIYRLVPY
jgi:glucose/arabinose dehydrogenase